MRPQMAAFTLVELMAVLALLGVLAGAVALSASGATGRATLSGAAGVLEHADRLARLEASRSGRDGRLIFRLDSAEVRREWNGAAADRALPSGVQVTSVRTGGATVRSGEYTLEVSRQGRTPTYSVTLEHQSRRCMTLVVCGWTGQTARLEEVNDEAAERLLAELARRPDSH